MNKSPFDLHLPLCLFDQLVTEDQPLKSLDRRFDGRSRTYSPGIAPSTSAIPATSPMARPTSFSGEAVSCNGFLLQCSLYFELQSHQFTTERAKVAFIISLLNGRALQWAEALWSSQSQITKSPNHHGPRKTAGQGAGALPHTGGQPPHRMLPHRKDLTAGAGGGGRGCRPGTPLARQTPTSNTKLLPSTGDQGRFSSGIVGASRDA